MVGRRGLAALVAVQLGIGLVVAAGTVAERSAPAVAAPHISEAPDPGTAMAAARRQGEPVAVASLGTPNRKVSAQPNGTMTAELAAQPMQVLRDGHWVPVDPTLVIGPDRTVRPKAVTY